MDAVLLFGVMGEGGLYSRKEGRNVDLWEPF